MFDSNLRQGTRQGLLTIGALAMIVLFALPFVGWLVHGDSLSAVVRRELIYWACSAAVILFVVLAERRNLSSIGLGRFGLRSVGWGVAGGVCAVSLMALLYFFVLPHLATSYGHKAGAVLALPFALRVEIVARAAVFEEVFYRGFMIERLSVILRSRRVAALLSFAAFTAAHLSYWGWGSLLLAGSGGLVLTALYLWRGDLYATMIAHALTDAVALLT